ncbi:tyrosine-type recombinase/integrase [Aeromonas bivalvium]|uniref:tyrosine-type recombinase/integrase n=1 Tax=Aeromonas bivalvium TaxID=440079 RepID=UPI0038CFDB75
MHVVIQKNEPIVSSQIDSIEIEAGQKADGVLFLDKQFKVVEYPSEWLSHEANHRRISEQTVVTYSRNMRYFLEYIDDRMSDEWSLDEKLLNVHLSLLESWVRYQIDDLKLEASTVTNREMTIRAFYDYFTDKKRHKNPIENNPFPSDPITSKPNNKQVQAVSVRDVQNLMFCTPYERERTLLQFLLDSGVRISELPRVTYGDVQEAQNFVSGSYITDGIDKPAVEAGYAALLIHGSKGRQDSVKERHTVITKPTLDRLKAYHSSPLYKRYQRLYADQNTAPIFFNTQGRPFTKASIAALITRISKRAEKNGTLSKKAHAHLFRHSFAYLTLQDTGRGHDFLDRLVFVQKSLGHTSIKTTERYTNIPHDIYDSIVNKDGEIQSRIEKMQLLVDSTKTRIKLVDKK